MMYADIDTKNIFMYNVYSTVWDCRIFPKVILQTGPLFCNLLLMRQRKLRKLLVKLIAYISFEYECSCFDFFETFLPSAHNVAL